MQHGEAWRPVAERLAERYPSVLLDHATWTATERIAEIRAAAPPGSIVAGYSMGGRLALHAALAEPGRWRALVLVGVSAGVEDRAARRCADEELAAWIERQPIEAVVERWERLPIFSTQPEPLRAAQRPGRLSHDPTQLAQLLRSAGQGALDSVWERLPQLELPLLCLAGELDEAYVAAAERLEALTPAATRHTIPGCGHAPQLEQPGAVAREIARFLDARI